MSDFMDWFGPVFAIAVFLISVITALYGVIVLVRHERCAEKTREARAAEQDRLAKEARYLTGEDRHWLDGWSDKETGPGR